MARKHSKSNIYLLGSPAEKAAGEALLKEFPEDVRKRTSNMAGSTGWAALYELVDGLDMILTPDTGTMHLAAHLGTPVHAFFLSSAWCFETGPYGAGHTVYQAVRDCSPCLETAPCPHEVACLSPFKDPSFIRFMLTAKPEHSPAGLTCFNTDFDELGLVFKAKSGNDPEALARAKFRLFLTQYLKIRTEKTPESEHELASLLHREREWMTIIT